MSRGAAIRFSIVTIASILVGVGMSLFVPAFIAWKGGTTRFQRQDEIPPTSHDWPAFLEGRWPPIDHEVVYRDASWGVTYREIWSSESADAHRYALSELAYGWPFPALMFQSFLVDGPDGNSKLREFGPLFEGRAGIPFPKYIPGGGAGPWGWATRWLPTVIMPAGLAANTGFYGGVFLLSYYALRHARRFRRRRKGRCPKCAYDLKSDFSTGCPECGWNRKDADTLEDPCASSA